MIQIQTHIRYLKTLSFCYDTGIPNHLNIVLHSVSEDQKSSQKGETSVNEKYLEVCGS